MAFVEQHPTDPPAGYPSHLEEKVTLANGEVLWLRPIVPRDASALAAEFAVADDDTVYMRFFNPSFHLTADRLRYLTEIDYQSHMALAAMRAEGERSEGVAIARYVARSETDVEGAIVVKPQFRRLGIAGMLLGRLAAIAVAAGYLTMSASYLADNSAAARLLDRYGFKGELVESGVIVVTLDLEGE